MKFRPLLIYVSWLIRKGYTGFAFWPFVFLKSKEKASPEVINHERIHLRQQIEILVLPFYLLYFTEYLIRRMQYPSWHEAYMNISFEREAFTHDKDIEYLSERPFWAWTSFYHQPKA